MRKQTKLVAVLSAAALLAIGASMTSFAAGWQKNDDGTWNYYDSDDEMVTGEWKKDGAKWFYLDDDGVMVTDSWVDDEYYVDESGAMLVNSWKKTLSSDGVDDPEDDGEAWYYFGSKGKKTGSGESTSKKIGGKTYYFDEDGKMKDGWMLEGQDFYYLGDEDDGARKTGWLWLEAPDDSELGHELECSADCDEEGWYYFGSDGKSYSGATKKKVNGKYYFFNDHGQMLYEWINGEKVDAASPENAIKDGKVTDATASEAANMLYMNVVEEGWRADGWYQIDGAKDTDSNNDTDWYFFKDGKAKKADMTTDNYVTWSKEDSKYRARIKVNGKYFCFNEIGQMQTGLQFVPAMGTAGSFYYFDENGYMKTGKVSNVEEDNDSFTYLFETKTGKLGQGITGVKSGYLYWNGKRLEADDDYKVYRVEGKNYLVNKSGKVQTSAKEYVVENNNGEEFSFTFKKSTSEIDKIKAETAGGVVKTETPKIELYDNVKPGEQSTDIPVVAK